MTESFDPYAGYGADDLRAGGPRDVATAGRHPVNITHLIFGIGFVAIVAVWSLAASDTIDPNDARWLFPLPWLLAGAGGLLAWMLSQRSSRE